MFPQQEQLDAAAGVRTNTEETGGHDARVVQHEQVAGLQEGGKVADLMVVERPGPAVHDEQAGGVAGLDRLLCDELGRQVVVEVGGAHAGSIALSRAAV